ncbi:hypothetical protein PQB86_gp127 [Klebsiella phage Miami]|uniref:Uncharacterized protein n=1 Tax=Klebsiella phage Miami TaxID=2767581 RepID=A0A873WJL7_9CAUD|nr:hypothetical protein PQB86_gp127 [Klebsiella phage Miami]QPB09222.1 hypothetical protein CPT_Miami_127 [Klebsiella phage Miami]WNY41138.1 hypothetical protein [Klebsiella phage YC1]WPH68667.1 hypothetical protein [Stenotrophomonas phage BUCTxx100]
MSKLSSSAVNDLFCDCLAESEEDPDVKVVVGIVGVFIFDPAKLIENKESIVSFLMELPEKFQEEKGGGWSFLEACMDKEGNHWAEHPTIERLMGLGIAIDKVEYVLPREMWSVLPGGMPYFVIKK